MDNKFVAKSPLGYEVHCSNHRWYNHIITDHPEMDGREALVSDAIEDPVVIYESNEYTNRDVYFGDNFNDSTEHLLYTKVIVSRENEPPYVVTAFPHKGVGGNINEGVMKYVKTKL